jgi:hypothetical protein
MALLRVLVICLSVILAAGQCVTGAEDLVVETGVDRRIVAIGDTFSLHLDLDWQEGVEVKPLPVIDRIGGFVVRDIRESLISRSAQRLKRRISLLLTVFETGSHTIPPLDLFYLTSDGSTHSVSTLPLEIQVESVLPEDAQDIRDIRGPLTVRKRWKDIVLSYLLLVGLAAGTAASILVSVKRKQEIEMMLLRIWRRVTTPLRRLFEYLLTLLGLIRRPAGAAYNIEVTEPDLVPEEAALKELDRIEALELSAQGLTKDLYTLVSETVRRYVERKYGVLAMESPVSHTLDSIDACGVAGEGYETTRDVLEEADLVKFARFVPPQALVDSLIGRARRIVMLTARSEGRVVSGGSEDAT